MARDTDGAFASVAHEAHPATAATAGDLDADDTAERIGPSEFVVMVAAPLDGADALTIGSTWRAGFPLAHRRDVPRDALVAITP